MAGAVSIHAMIDISDGLSTDLNRICRQSGVGALVEAASIPISPAAQEERDPLAAALNEGEDFELLFTLPTEAWEQLRALWDRSVPITRIGSITETLGMQIVMPGGQCVELRPAGYEHLRSERRQR